MSLRSDVSFCVCAQVCVYILVPPSVCVRAHVIITFNDKVPAFAQLSCCNTNNIQLFLLLLSSFVTPRHKFELLSVLRPHFPLKKQAMHNDTGN